MQINEPASARRSRYQSLMSIAGVVLLTMWVFSSMTSVPQNTIALPSETKTHNSLDEPTHIYSPTELREMNSHITNSGDSSSGKPVALVTGITGMIGSYVAKALIKTGRYRVVGIVRYRSDLFNLGGYLNDIKLVYGDINDKGRMRDIVTSEQPSYIFHFAAQAINGVSYDSAELTLQTNIQGTFNMLEAVRSAGLTKSVRFLLAGSSTEYGVTADTWDGPIPEHAPMSPVSPYGVSKASAELLVRQYYHTYKMHVITARFFIQVAAGGTEHLAVQEFCRQIAMIENGLQDPVLMHGSITTKRDVTDMRDSASVVVSLAEKGLAGEAYNIGSGIAVSVKEILDTALSYSYRKDIQTKEDSSRLRLYDEKILLSDNSKVRKLTDWVPSPDIKQTVEDILQFWRRKIKQRYATAADYEAEQKCLEEVAKNAKVKGD